MLPSWYICQIDDVKRVKQALGVTALRCVAVKWKEKWLNQLYFCQHLRNEYKTISSMINDVINGPFDYDVSYL